ncbi:MAG: hypothetical protein ABI681_09390 [Gemmatimonadales bacterium]
MASSQELAFHRHSVEVLEKTIAELAVNFEEGADYGMCQRFLD